MRWRSFAAIAILGIVAPLLGTLAVVGVADLLLVAASALFAGVAAFAARHRMRIAALPLELCPQVLSGEVGGHPAYRFRVRLGRGRLMREPRAEVRFRRDDGVEVALRPLVAEAERLVGPWTLVVVDADRACEAPGSFQVTVRANERGRSWQADGVFARDAVRSGRFGPGMQVADGRLCFDPGRWDEVV